MIDRARFAQKLAAASRQVALDRETQQRASDKEAQARRDAEAARKAKSQEVGAAAAVFWHAFNTAGWPTAQTREVDLRKRTWRGTLSDERKRTTATVVVIPLATYSTRRESKGEYFHDTHHLVLALGPRVGVQLTEDNGPHMRPALSENGPPGDGMELCSPDHIGGVELLEDMVAHYCANHGIALDLPT